MDANSINITEINSGISYLSDNVNTFITLGITILAELIAFFVFIKKYISPNNSLGWTLFIIGMNCLTNPLAQMVYSNLRILNGFDWLITEMLVILGETGLICGVMRQSFQRALLYSVLLNITSILAGAILCWLNLLPWCH